jgi:Icc-related predicted phosphoesterase
MKILALSDKVESCIYNSGMKSWLGDIDLIIGCGDLPANYLEYVVTQLNVPLVYVPGNHDSDSYHVPGGRCIDGKATKINGLTIAGLGGSIRYKPKGRHQYTQWQMGARVGRLIPSILLNGALRQNKLDILITHSPALGIHDGEDPAHIGFSSFITLLRAVHPRLMLHGHMHAIRNIDRTITTQYGCQIMNVFPYQIIDLPPNE